jgi:acyl-CoA thioesterase FadM
VSAGRTAGRSAGRPDPEVARGITVPYRARFDECGPDGLVRSSALLRYAQDVAWIHSERLGFDRTWYAARDLAWVVRAIELAILEPLPLGRVLALSTAVTGFRRVWARRRSEGRSEDGRLLLWAHTDWVMTDVRRGMPGRVPDEFPAAFDVPPGGFEPGRVALGPAPGGASRHRSSVRPQDLDPMGHVNNAAYVDYLEEALADAGPGAAAARSVTPRRIRLEYAAPAAASAALEAELWPEPHQGVDGWAWRLRDHAGAELARARVLTGGPLSPSAPGESA